MALTLPVGQEDTWLGTFGEHWFRTVCSVAGLTTSRPVPDTVGTDFVVQNCQSETIRVQVKTTESPHAIQGGYSFDLDVSTYNKLRVGNTNAYLTLIVAKELHPRWTGHCHRGSTVRASAYWADLTGLPATTNTVTIAVRLPFEKLLTPLALQGLF
jgi:hypothetical protein